MPDWGGKNSWWHTGSHRAAKGSEKSLTLIFEKAAISKLKLAQKRENHIREPYQIYRQLNRKKG